MNDKAVRPWEKEMAEQAKAIAKQERPPISAISFRAGVMSYMGQPVPGNTIQGVIIAHVVSNVFYSSKFDPNNRVNPDCFAISPSDDNMRPHEAVKEPVAATCDECPNFKWGSAPNGGRGKACKERRRLALIPVKAVQDNQVAAAEIAVLNIPVTSIKNWKLFVNKLASIHSRPPWGVFAQISLKPHAKNQFEVVFEDKGLISEEALGAIHARIPSAIDLLMQPYDETGNAEPQPETPTKKAKF